MKRFITIMILCMLLCSCGTSTKDVPEHTQQSGSASNSAGAVSESPLITESSAATESPSATRSPVPTKSEAPIRNSNNSAGDKSTYVTDITGEKHKLKIGNVDIMDEGGVEFSQTMATAAYSQVVDDHYYFMRSDGKRNYTVYRDKREKVGTFSLKGGYVEYCAFYKKKFFILIRELPEKKRDESFKLVEIDLKSQRMREVCNCLTDLGVKKDDDLTPVGLYQGMFIYFYDNDTKLGRFDLQRRKVVQSKNMDLLIPIKGLSYQSRSWNWLCFGSKIYYAVRYEDHVVIYTFELRRGVRKEVFRFNCVDEFGQPEKIKDYTEVVGLDMDEDYIYCQGYGIPRRGGEMVRLFRFEETTVNQPPYAHNRKYIYYIYDDQRLRRINKKTLKSKIICDKAVMDIKCTTKGLYIQEYTSSVSIDYAIDNSDEYDFGPDEENVDIADSCNLYYMDFNGKNVKRIWKGKEFD